MGVARELGAGMLLLQFAGMRVRVVGCGDLENKLSCSLLVWVQLLRWWLCGGSPLDGVKRSWWFFVVRC